MFSASTVHADFSGAGRFQLILNRQHMETFSFLQLPHPTVATTVLYKLGCQVGTNTGPLTQLPTDANCGTAETDGRALATAAVVLKHRRTEQLPTTTSAAALALLTFNR